MGLPTSFYVRYTLKDKKRLDVNRMHLGEIRNEVEETVEYREYDTT
jgi:hypothetical protein